MRTRKPRVVELAWAAGLFDGEGCTYVSYTRGNPYLRVQVSQNHTGVLNRFLRAVGVGTIHGPYNKEYKYQATSQAARIVLAKLWPYLSSIKIIQALRAMDGV